MDALIHLLINFLPFSLQCYTHRNLGWKIIVVEPGEAPPEVSAGSVVFSSKQLLVELMTILVALVAGWVYA